MKGTIYTSFFIPSLNSGWIFFLDLPFWKLSTVFLTTHTDTEAYLHSTNDGSLIRKFNSSKCKCEKKIFFLPDFYSERRMFLMRACVLDWGKTELCQISTIRLVSPHTVFLPILIRYLTLNKVEIWTGCFFPGDQNILAGSIDGDVSIWSVDTGNKKESSRLSDNSIMKVAVVSLF